MTDRPHCERCGGTMPHASGNYTQIGYCRRPSLDVNGAGHWYYLCPTCWGKVSKFIWGWRGKLAHYLSLRKIDRTPNPLRNL